MTAIQDIYGFWSVLEGNESDSFERLTYDDEYKGEFHASTVFYDDDTGEVYGYNLLYQDSNNKIYFLASSINNKGIIYKLFSTTDDIKNYIEQNICILGEEYNFIAPPSYKMLRS